MWASVCLQTGYVLLPDWQARPSHAAACLPRGLGTVAAKPVRRAQPLFATRTSGTNSTAAPDHHQTTTDRPRSTTQHVHQNLGSHAQADSGHTGKQAEAIDITSLSFPPGFTASVRPWEPGDLSRAAFFFRTKSSQRALLCGRRLHASRQRKRPLQALQALQAAGLAWASCLQYDRPGRVANRGGRAWEPCNRCDVLRHIVRSWHARFAFPSGPRPLARASFLPMILPSAGSCRAPCGGLRLMSGWLGARYSVEQGPRRFVTGR